MHERTEPRPFARPARRLPGGAASFGTVAFPFRRALRRGDDTVIVVVELDDLDRLDHSPALAQLFAAASQHGVAQLCLGSTLCRARPLRCEPDAGSLVFELHRHPDAPPTQ